MAPLTCSRGTCPPRRHRATRSRHPPARRPSSTTRRGRTRWRADRVPMKRTESPGVCSPGSPGWYRPMTPCFFSPTRSRRMLVEPPPRGIALAIHQELVGGDQGHAAPRQQRCAEEGDGRWRHAATRALAAEGGDRPRMREEERGFLPDLAQEFVEVVGCGRALARLDALGGGDVVQQPVAAVVDEFALLALLDRLDGQPELLGDLIEGVAVQVRHLGRDLQDARDRVERVLARLLLVVHEGRRNGGLRLGLTHHFDGFLVHDAVQPQRARFHGLPVEQANEPARRDRPVLRRASS